MRWAWVIVLGLTMGLSFPAQAEDEITIAFDHAGDIYVTDFEGAPMNLTASPADDVAPAWSPDGSRLAFLSKAPDDSMIQYYAYVITVATGETKRLSDLEMTSESQLAWSPDGRSIALVYQALWVVNVETGVPRRLTTDGVYARNPVWSQDNLRLAFKSGDVYVIDSDGRDLWGIHDVTHSQARPVNPAWSPTSNEIVFVSGSDGTDGLYLLDVDSTTMTTLIEMAGYEIYIPYWSPDGQRLAFNAYQRSPTNGAITSNSVIYVIDRSTAEMRPLTSDDYLSSVIGWASDGERVVYWQGIPGDAGGSYYAMNITDGTVALLSDTALDRMCSYGDCRNMSVRP